MTLKDKIISQGLLGLDTSELEKIFNLQFYYETKASISFDDFFENLLPLFSNPLALKTNDGVLDAVIEMPLDEIKQAFKLQLNNKGPFFDEDIEVSYWLFDGQVLCFFFGNMFLTTNTNMKPIIEQTLEKLALDYYSDELW